MKRIFTDIQDFGDDEYDSDGKESTQHFQAKTEATIFLVDAREKMFVPSKEEELPFVRCLKSVRNAIRDNIFSFQKCFCSIILLGTKESDNPLKLNNIRIVQELKLLGAEHVMKIDEILKAVEDSLYEKKYGFAKFSLGDALWLCSHIFNQRSKNLNKTVIFLTNDDDPPSDDQNDESRAVTSAQDMYKSSTAFDLIHVGEDFDVNKFYKKIILASHNDPNYIIPDPVVSDEDMLKRISKKNYKHLSVVKIPFVISKDFKIGVSVYVLVKKIKNPFKVKLSKATNEGVTTKVQYFESESGSLVNKDELIMSQHIGLKDIYFTQSELKAISEVAKPELRLLGFKPASVLRLENFIKPCAFIYPDDSTFKGSSVFFTTLLLRCIEKEVVAICAYCPRASSSYRFVALLAQDECLREDKSQESPPGFILFYLPYAEEVRTLPDKTTQKAEPEQIELAMKVIKKLRFNYKLESFPNPKLAYHWAAIEALALDLKEREEVNDGTYPNYDLISHRSGEFAKQFIESVYPDDYDPGQPTKKKPKSVGKQSNFSPEYVEELFRSGKGENLTNDALKNYLKSVGKGKGLSKITKAELLEKVGEHLNLN